MMIGLKMIKYSTIVDLVNFDKNESAEILNAKIDAAGELLRRIFFKPPYDGYEFLGTIKEKQEKVPIPWIDFKGNKPNSLGIVRYDCIEIGPVDNFYDYFHNVGTLEIENDKKITCFYHCDGDSKIIFQTPDFVLVNSDAKKQYWCHYDNLDNYYLAGN